MCLNEMGNHGNQIFNVSFFTEFKYNYKTSSSFMKMFFLQKEIG